MSMKNENILGYIKLDTGFKPISPLNDVFLNYTFEREEYWETLRKITNIFYSAYISTYKDTKITLIEGEIDIRTQYPLYRMADSATPKQQDVKIDTEDKIHYIDFQNKTNPTIPIEARSIEYLGFSLTRGEKKQVSNVWLINGQVTNLMHGNIFSNYILTDEIDHRPHPNSTNVLYVDLKRLHLTQTSSKAGELAGVLIGAVDTPNDRDVAQIFQNLKNSFDVFKNDTEAQTIMTRMEELKEEGRIEGKAEAKAEFIPRLNEKDKQLTEKDEQLTEKDEQLTEKDEQLAKKDKEIEKLKAMLAKN